MYNFVLMTAMDSEKPLELGISFYYIWAALLIVD